MAPLEQQPIDNQSTSRMIDGRITFMRRASACLLASTALFWLALVGQTQTNFSSSSLRSLSILSVRPIIYTFIYNREQQDTAFLKWQRAWSAAGYDARPLYLQHAQQHAHFDQFAEQVSQLIPFHQEHMQGYYRYLGMITVGGGMLADMNVFPLSPAPLQVQPSAFTVMCGSATKAGACLASGSEREWERIAVELLNSIKRRSKDLYSNNKNTLLGDDEGVVPVWTNELAIQEITSFANPSARPLAKHEAQVVSMAQARQMQTLVLATQCATTTQKLAVKLPLDIAEDWLREWNAGCGAGSKLSSRVA